MSSEKPVVDEQLEARLAGLTEWAGTFRSPYERAAVQAGGGWGWSGAAGAVARVAGRLPRPRRLRRLEVAAVVAVGGVVVLAVSSRVARMNAEPGERAVASKSPDAPTAFYRYKAADAKFGESSAGSDSWRDAPELDLQASFQNSGARGEGLKSPFGVDAERLRTARIQPGSGEVAGPAARQIIRRAAMDVVALDVMGAFRKAQDLVKPELSEFVQESTVSGAGSAMSARIVLRVDPSRLAFVMQAARGLGVLASEQTGGDDVTDRLQDLDAQIRNEQRVEKEMLDLFDLRKDAPLKDVLELREQLARVRGTIERLQAQKAQAERLVALATLTLTIRPEPDKAVAPPPVDETPSFGARVSQSISHAWERGTNSLASFAGWTVETAVGGLPVWGTVTVVGVLVWRAVRNRKRDRQGA